MIKKSSTKKPLFISIGVVVIIGIIIGVLFFNNPASDSLKKTIGIKQTAPVFIFNEQVANGWWATDNYNNRENAAKDYKGEEPIDTLPVAFINTFQSKDMTINSCFVMYTYYDYPVDVDALRREKEERMNDTSSVTYTKLASDNLSMDTPDGMKSYELHEYAISGPNSKQMQRGMSFGYIELSNGYVSIDGTCPEGDMLKGATAGMKSISLVKKA